jgi:hypothetical protein
MARLAWLLVPLAALQIFGSACSGKKGCPPLTVSATQSCTTTQDCVDANYVGLSCVNGTCQRPCQRDEDCSVSVLNEFLTDKCKQAQTAKPPTFICEQELCTAGCPEVACADGERCTNGRCTVFSEGFEGTPNLPIVTLENIGWNDLPREKTNDRTKVVFSGRGGCQLGDNNCAGPAAEGEHFLALATTPTPPVGTANSGVTCRACACCLECRLNPAGAAPDLATCPTGNAPSDYVCADAIPSVCQNICNLCDQCATQDQMGTGAPNVCCTTNCMAPESHFGEGLLSCELEAARRTCTACEAYDRCVSDQRTMRGCCTNANDSCHQFAGNPTMCLQCIDAACDAQKATCNACRDSLACQLSNPGSSACIQVTSTCNGQGADGCFPTPVDRPRSALTDAEQSALSKEIPLQAAMGSLVLELDYVPFDVHDKYVHVMQNVPRSMWPRETQEVAIQLCAGDCTKESSWVDGKLLDGSKASIPPLTERANGLTLGGQTAIDWSSGHARVEIPDALKTQHFRLRFVPRLDDSASVGIDAVVIRRKP